MKIGLVFGDFAWAGGASRMADTLAAVSRSADDAGVSLIGTGDHIWQSPEAGGATQPWLECFTVLATVAANTTRCRVGPVCTAVHFRPPALLAKMVTTLDVLSGGRAMLGIGAGWYDEEAQGNGLAYPSLADRYEMVEETIHVCRRMWDGETGDGRPYDGKHYQVGRPLNVPQNLSRPHPPIMIGGEGERKTLRLVARYADACNIFGGPDVAHKLDVLRAHCADVGRDYDSIEKTAILPLEIGPDGAGAAELVDELGRLAELGIEAAHGILFGPDPVGVVDVLGTKVIPEVAER